MVYWLSIAEYQTNPRFSGLNHDIHFVHELQGFAETAGETLRLGPEISWIICISDACVGRLKQLGTKLLGAPLSLCNFFSMVATRQPDISPVGSALPKSMLRESVHAPSGMFLWVWLRSHIICAVLYERQLHRSAQVQEEGILTQHLNGVSTSCCKMKVWNVVYWFGHLWEIQLIMHNPICSIVVKKVTSKKSG